MTIFELLLCLTFRMGCWGNERVEVDTGLGKISGYYKTSYAGKKIATFEGIPYAKPPIGKLRFKEPEKVEPWSGVLKANKKHVCIQWNGIKDTISGTEDCLYVNIYVPRNQPSKHDNLDVIVNFHGGIFMVGNGHEFAQPTYLMDRDVILVTFNSRVSALGFLCSDDGEMSCNNGLKDQTMMLRWIQEHIKSFGGNPHSVTLTGFSAGGASLHYHYVSPLSKGLFHRGVSFSGTVLNPWAYQKHPREKFKKFAAVLNCNSNSTSLAVSCLRKRSAKSIANTYRLFSGYGNVFPLCPFGPRAEKYTHGAFLLDHPYKLLRDGHINDVPWINSLTAEESLFFTVGLIQTLKTLNKKWDSALPHILDYNYTASRYDFPEINKRVTEKYLGGKKVTQKSFMKFSKMVSDRLFNVDSVRSSKVQAKVAKSQVYDIWFTYVGQHSVTRDLYGNPRIFDVTHGDDVLYVYGGFYDKPLTYFDEQMKNVYLDLIMSFIKTNEPKVHGVQWQPVPKSDFEEFTYLHVKGPMNCALEKKDELVPLKFWDSLPIKENDKLYYY